MSQVEERNKALELAVGQIEKQFGKGSVMRLGADVQPAEVPSISTGSLGLDVALGVGGFPRGRVVEIYGPESSGKTTLALQVIAEAQKQGGIASFVDAEHALDIGYARKLGVKTADLLVSQPDSGEQDPMYEEALRVILEMGKASTSTLQRRLRLGYGRAARILDTMQREGIIGPPDGSRPRDVLKRPDWLSEVEQLR